MTGDTITKILDIRVKYDDAIKNLASYRTSLDQIAAAEKQLKQELKEGVISQDHYSQQISALTQNKKYLQSATKEVTRAVQANIRVEKEQEGSLTQLRARLSELTGKYDKLSRAAREGLQGAKLKSEINDITKAIKDAEMATQRFYRNVGNYQSALTGLRELGGAFKVFGGIVAGVLGGLGLEKFTNGMIEVAKNFEDAMARIRAVADPNSGEFAKLRDRALELGKETRFTATEVANAMEELARKGYSANESMELVGHVLKLAQANVTSMADAAQIATQTMRSFGLGIEETERTVDVLSSACSHSATNLLQLGEAMKTAGPAARTANVSLESTVALIGSLANVGMTGSDAGTGVKQVLMALTTAMNGTEKARKVLEHYNLDITEARIRSGELMDILREMKQSGIGNSLADLKMISGKYASPRLANIINNVDETAGLEDILKNSIGENARMSEESIGKTSDALYKLKSAWENMLISMYDSTSEYLVTPINWLREAINALSGQITLLGQTFVSVLAGVAASAGWKGLLSIGGFLSATWSDVKSKAVVNLKEFEQAYAIAQQHLIELKEKEATITTQLDEASARKVAILEEQRTLTHNIEEAKRTMTTKVENAKRTMEEAKAAAKAKGLSKEEIAEIVRTHKAGISAITASEKAGIRAMEAEQRRYVKVYAQNEATITRLAQEQSIARREITAAENNVRIAEAEKLAAASTAPSLTSWKGFWNLTTGAFRAIGGMLKSFLPFLVIFGVLEFIQGLKRVMGQMSEIEKAEDKVREKAKLAVTEDKKLSRLRAMKDMIREINKEQTNNNKLTEQSHKNLVAIANRLKLSKEAQAEINKGVKIQASTYKAMIKSVDELIKKQTEQAKKNALTGIVEEANSQVIKLAIDYGIEETDINKIDTEFQKKFNDEGVIAKGWQVGTNFFGAENIYSSMQKVRALVKQYNFALQELAKLGGGVDELVKTEDGGYNPSNIGENKKGKDFMSQLQKWINTLKDQREKYSNDVDNDKYSKARKKTGEEVLKFFREIETHVGTTRYVKLLKALGVDTKKGEYFNFDDANMPGTLSEALQKKPKYAKIIMELAKEVIELGEDKWYNALQAIEFDRFNKKQNTAIAHYRDRLDVTPKSYKKTNVTEESLEEYRFRRDLIMDDYRSGKYGLDDAKARKRRDDELERLNWELSEEAAYMKGKRKLGFASKVNKEYFDIQEKIINTEWARDEKDILLKYYTGEYGGTKIEGSFEKIAEGLNEYREKYAQILEDYRSGKLGTDEETANNRKADLLKSLDEEYKAEAEYMHRLEVLEYEHEKKSKENSRQYYDEMAKIREQGIQNELSQLQLKYETELNMAYDHYQKLGFASEEYWERLKGRIGEQEAMELKLEWELATTELENIKHQQWDSNVESYEAYQARLIAAQQKVESVHTKANETIEKSDETRFQATQTIVKGLITLSEQEGQENKDMAHLSKTLALFNIMVNTAEAIAKMTSREAGKGILGLTTMASGIATILANMASATSMIRSAKFAKGAVNIGGAGTETSDSIPAYISRGESVINAKATKMFEPLLIAINAIGNGVALPRNNYVSTQQTADMKEAFIAAVAEIRPVVDVREVTHLQNRVETLQNLDSL